jgi:hypothetical protein
VERVTTLRETSFDATFQAGMVKPLQVFAERCCGVLSDLHTGIDAFATGAITCPKLT